MPRPRSDDKRAAIMSAAARIIATQGLGAPTAAIAKEAGVSNGSLFTYFDTKSDLFNQLYHDLKTDMAGAAVGRLSADAEPREQMLALWSGWLHWATTNPEKRRALVQLQVSDEITPDTHAGAAESMAGVAQILERIRRDGPMRDTPLSFLLTLANALSEATIDFVLQDPENVEAHGRAGFDALWRMIA